jgi:hypothetical protein
LNWGQAVRLVCLTALLTTCATSIPASAEYPDRAIRLIVSQAAVAPTLVTELAKDLG